MKLDVNYYVLLELDPTLDATNSKDKGTIGKVIAQKIVEWKKALQVSQVKVEPLQIIRARVGLTASHQMKGDLQGHLEVWAGHKDNYARLLNESEVRRSAAARECLNVLGGPEIEERLAGKLSKALDLGDSLVADVASKLGYKLTKRARLPKALRDVVGIRTGLRHILDELGVGSIYELLSNSSKKAITPLTPPDEVLAALLELRETHNRGVARHEDTLFFKALHVFRPIVEGSEQVKNKVLFDRLEAFNSVQHLEGLISLLPKSGQISATQFNTLVAFGQGSGQSIDDVTEHFKDLLLLRNIQVAGDQEKPPLPVLICAYCSTLNDARDSACSACKQSLWETCFNCGSRRSAATQVCPSCNLSSIVAVNAAGAAARGAMMAKLGQVEDAKKQLTILQEAAPRAATNLAKAIEAACRTASVNSAKIEALLAASRVHTAKASLDALGPGEYAPDAASQRSRVEGSIHEAAIKTAAASQALQANDNKKALDLVLLALAKATDCIAARGLLACIPPSTPKNLRVQTTSTSAVLTWTGVLDGQAGLGATYRVIRTLDLPPVHERDGELITMTRQTGVVDKDCPAGRRVFYAVYAVREKAVSPGCTMVGPTLLLSPIENLTARQTNESLNFSWEKPAGAQSVEITRWVKSQKPQGPSKPLGSAQLQWTDTSPESAGVISYQFVARYDVIGEGLLSSEPVYYEASLMPVPSHPHLLSLDNEAGSLRWKPAATSGEGDHVLAYKSKPALTCGQVASMDSLPKPAYSFAMGSATHCDPSIFGEYWFVVVRQRGELVNCSAASKRILLPPVEDASVSQAGNVVTLTWKWPTGCTTARVAVTKGHMAAELSTLKKEGESPCGIFEIVANAPCEIQIGITAISKDARLESIPVELLYRLTTPNKLTFTVVQRNGGVLNRSKRTVSLKLTLERTEPMPAFQVYFGDTPLPSANEGECLVAVPANSVETKEGVFKLTEFLNGRNGYIGVVLTNPQDRDRIKVYPENHQVNC